MTKNLKISYILTLLFSAVVIAWNTFFNFFHGVGINFIVLVSVVAVLLFMLLTDKFVASRIRDIFIISAVFLSLEFIMYFVLELGIVSVYSNAFNGFAVYQAILSCFGIVFFIYTMFRFLIDLKEIKLSFIETMLGNNKGERKEKKEKQAKELSNGSLEEKPNKIHAEDISTDDSVIVEVEESEN